MELARFQRIVARCEQIAATRPRTFEWSVGGLAVVGYLYLALVCAGLLALFGFLAAVTVASPNGGTLLWSVVPLYTLLVIARSLRFQSERIDGLEVPLSAVPRLARLLEEISARAEGPRIDRLVIRVDPNASLGQYPRAGVLGWYESTLAIGMPLLQALPEEELPAILAHEIAHLNGGHGRLGIWIGRQLASYQYLEQHLQGRRYRRLGAWALYPLVRWYLPFLYAINFALRRQHEYDADRFAAEFAGEETARRALVRIALLSQWHHLVRNPALSEAANAGRPVPTHIFDAYPAQLAADITPARAREWLELALRVETDFSDSHPALRDRLKAIGGPAEAGTPIDWDPTGPKAIRWLAPISDLTRERANVAWAAAATPGWHAQLKRSTAIAEHLQTLPAPSDELFDVAREWERAALIEQQEGPLAALSAARAVVVHAPEHIAARFLVARGLLAGGDETGLLELERLVARSPDLVRPAAVLAFPYLWRQGRAAEAEAWRQRSAERESLRSKAALERRTGYRRMHLAPARLSPESIARFRHDLASIKDVKEVYIARRLVRLAPELPTYVVVVVPRLGWFGGVTVARLRTINQTVFKATAWPHDTVVLAAASGLKGLRRKVRKFEDSQLYPAPGA